MTHLTVKLYTDYTAYILIGDHMVMNKNVLMISFMQKKISTLIRYIWCRNDGQQREFYVSFSLFFFLLLTSNDDYNFIETFIFMIFKITVFAYPMFNLFRFIEVFCEVSTHLAW